MLKKLKLLKNLNEIMDIKAGDSYRLILTIDDSVFGCGKNCSGSVGFEQSNEIISTNASKWSKTQ